MQVIWNILARVIVLCMVLGSGSAKAHDEWSNGNPIPAWVKAHCCSSSDSHDLTKEMGITAADVTSRQGGNPVYVYYKVKGFENEVNAAKVYASQDGDVWAFYGKGGPPQATIWCLFVPCVDNPDLPNELNSSCS